MLCTAPGSKYKLSCKAMHQECMDFVSFKACLLIKHGTAIYVMLPVDNLSLSLYLSFSLSDSFNLFKYRLSLVVNLFLLHLEPK